VSGSKSAGRSREPPDRGDQGQPAHKRPRVNNPSSSSSSGGTTAVNSRAMNNFHKASHSSDTHEDDDIQEVVPVKMEPREVAAGHLTPVTPSSSSSTAMTPVTGTDFAGQEDRGGSGGGGQLVLDDEYAEDSYDYGGEYGEGGGLYAGGDDSGLMDSGLAMPTGADGNKGRLLLSRKMFLLV
jgi:hypothetical protein